MFEQAYRPFAIANGVFVGLAAFAVAIAGVGMLGMASFMTAARTREIGLRKSLGADKVGILRLLVGEFTKPVVAANFVVWPLVVIAGRAYLNTFVTRADLTPLPLLFALTMTLLIACAAVGSYVLRAASMNPSDALRDE
jgi:putative ABC transport system permease protein